jgi:hypothetical protein
MPHFLIPLSSMLYMAPHDVARLQCRFGKLRAPDGAAM